MTTHLLKKNRTYREPQYTCKFQGKHGDERFSQSVTTVFRSSLSVFQHRPLSLNIRRYIDKPMNFLTALCSSAPTRCAPCHSSTIVSHVHWSSGLRCSQGCLHSAAKHSPSNVTTTRTKYSSPHHNQRTGHRIPARGRLTNQATINGCLEPPSSTLACVNRNWGSLHTSISTERLRFRFSSMGNRFTETTQPVTTRS